MRTFESGATRDDDKDKLDLAGFFSPLVLERFAVYMHKHQKTAGGVRAGDDWKKGIPQDAYMRSLLRHTLAAWIAHEKGAPIEDALCAVLFNAMGYLFEELQKCSRLSNISC